MLELSDYRIVERLHEGGASHVYHAVRNADMRDVVVKTTRRANPTRAESAPLEHEFRILRQTSITGVPKVHELRTIGATHALVRDYAPGDSVASMLARGPLDLETALRIALSVAGILGGLHRAGIQHRDIKPRNIVYEIASGAVNLVDFGVATTLSSEVQKLMAPDTLDGTLAYMSPEQTGRMNRSVDYRTDFYSLGVTIFEMLTGELPFESSDPMQLVHAHIARAAPLASDRNRSIPEGVSMLVAKLLSKAAEDRYQSARGLEHDLRHCLDELERSGTVDAFRLGEVDVTTVLRLPQKLYGRESQLAHLERSFARVSAGERMLLEIRGYSGVGKSSLVHEIHKPIARRGGYFVAGKFDQFNRNVPFSAITSALREFVNLALSEHAESIAAWKRRILDAVGQSGRLLTDLIPELERVIGPQPEVAPVGPVEAQNRFGLALSRFVRALAAPEHPLVLFLDDLQWADPASLSFVHAMLTSPDACNLLVLAAYRDNEVDASHPVARTLERLRDEGATHDVIDVAPLALTDVEAFIGDALESTGERVRSLAALVHAKTQGNPFFIGQFLRTIHRDGLLRFDPDLRSWTWSDEQIAKLDVTDNVADLLVRNIRALPEDVQRVLRLAACVGHRFDWATLKAIDDRTPRESAAALWGAMREGLVLPVDREYRFLDPDANVDPGELTFSVAFRFMHDRVQQAAYATVPEGERAAFHARIGRLLRDRVADADIFEVVAHLGRGVALIVDLAERLDLAKLYERAATKAIASTAHGAADELLRAAIDLLPEDAFTSHYDLAYSLYVSAAETNYFYLDSERAEALAEVVLAHARTGVDRARIQIAQVHYLTAQQRHKHAIEVGIAGARELGVDLPRHATQSDLLERYGRVGALVAEGGGPDLFERLQPMSDVRTAAVVDLLLAASPAAYISETETMQLFVLTCVELCIRFGSTPPAPTAYATYALLLAGTGSAELGLRVGEAAVAIADRPESRGFWPRTVFVHNAFVRHHVVPLADTIAPLDGAFEQALLVGDVNYACYATIFASAAAFVAGWELERLETRIEQYLEPVSRLRQDFNAQYLRVWRQLVENLRGLGPSDTSFGGSFCDPSTALDEFQRAGDAMSVFAIHTARTVLALVNGDHEAAVASATEGTPFRSSHFSAAVSGAFGFYGGLAHALYARTSGRESDLTRATELRNELELARSSSPTTFTCKVHGIDGALLWARGDLTGALRELDKAISTANDAGFVHEAAIFSELASDVAQSLGLGEASNAYAESAFDGFARWGATPKCERLVSKGRFVPAARGGRSRTGDTTSSSSTAWLTAGLDVRALLEAHQNLAGELVFDRLVERLLDIVVRTAGAQRGVLIRETQGALYVSAELVAEPSESRLGMRIPLVEYAALPVTVVRYVAQSRSPLVLGNASADEAYSGDAYVSRTGARSIAAIPLLHQGRLAGIVFLENALTPDAFTAQRVELLRVLSTQAAIAIENAALYTDLNATTGELRTLTENLEQQVEDRTKRLQAAHDELWAEMDLARKIQTVLLPDRPEIPGYEIAATMRPAAHVGGDYYDVFHAGKHDWFLIGDVSGHGVSAGLSMMMVRTAVRSTVQALVSAGITPSPSQLLELVNRLVGADMHRVRDGQYMTLTAMRIDRGTVRFAGLHLDLLVYRAARGVVECIETNGLWIGLLDEIGSLLTDETIELEPGDVLLAYTDGLTEARMPGGGMFETARTSAAFGSLASSGASCTEIIDAMLRQIAGCIVSDDVTVVAMRRGAAGTSIG